LYGIRTRIHALGYRNIKNITILGDAGGKLGMCMQGGKITVKGNAGYSVGYWMEGGEIHIEGEFVDTNDASYGAKDVTRGKVYVNGELVVDK
jgi:formylmethanofuran dehydrogenase subunit C